MVSGLTEPAPDLLVSDLNAPFKCMAYGRIIITDENGLQANQERKMNKLKFISGTLAALLISTTLLTGCNTLKGIGQDLKKGGEKLEETAKSKGAKNT